MAHRVIFFLLLLGIKLGSSGWIEIPPLNSINYCPRSPISYDCARYQQDVWNAPSLAYSPSSIPSSQRGLRDICVVFLPGTGGNAYQYFKGYLTSLSLLNYHVISLSYVSTSYSVSEMNYLCGDQSLNGNINTNECIHQLHASIVYGNESSSTIWGINSTDSISHRLLDTLQELTKQHSSCLE